MRKELKHQNEQYARPLILVTVEEDFPGDAKFYFRNEGFGPALNIKLEDFPINEKDNLIVHKSDPCDFISPKGRSKITFRNDDGKRTSKMFLPSPVKSYAIKTTYENVYGVQYVSIGKIVNRKSEIIKTEKID